MARDPLLSAKTYLQEKFPLAEAAFAANQAPPSDLASAILSLVIFLPQLPQSYRESLRIDGQKLELYVHDKKSWDYFCFSHDRVVGEAKLSRIVAEGQPLLPGTAKASQLVSAAKQMIKDGPMLLTEDQKREKRYQISVLLDELRAPHSHAEAIGSLSLLHENLADFYLRSHGQWSAHGHQIPAALHATDPDLAKRWNRVFTSAFMSDRSGLFSLVEDILEPFGGFLFDGFIRKAPESLRKESLS